MKTDFILYINDSRQEKGYTKCIYVRTTGRKVKKIGHNLHIHVLNGWITHNSSFKRHTKIANFEVIQCCFHLC